jgi:hypothetical protein
MPLLRNGNNRDIEQTTFNANHFLFRYKGAIISGALPSAYAGFVEHGYLGETEGAATVAMARQVYGVKTPEELTEPSLFELDANIAEANPRSA